MFFFYLLLIFIFNSSVFSKNYTTISLIRDTEIEDFVKEITYPILKSAKLDFNSINFYIVNDNSINAFVTNGQNIFINIGTLTKFSSVDAVIAILAHETGHISAGHISRIFEKINSTQKLTISSILLGIGSLIVGLPELGQMLIFGSLQIQQQDILKYTRIQEQTADNLAVEYLHKNNLSASALLTSMEYFSLSELEYSNNVEYYLTHPLSRNRKEFIKNQIKKENSNLSMNNIAYNEKYKDRFNFIKAKIFAYNEKNSLSYSKEVDNIDKNNKDYKLYYDSIISIKNGKYDIALNNINYLINKYKENQYFYELLGDIYFAKSDIKLALKYYMIADEKIKNNLLIKKMISYLIIKNKQISLYDRAKINLNYIISIDKKDLSSYKLLAELYYNNNQKSLSYLNLAKYYEIKDNFEKTKYFIDLAKKNTDNQNILNEITDFEITLSDEFKKKLNK